MIGVRPDDAALDRDRGSDEQADTDADGALEIERDGVHDGFAQTGEHQEQDDDALDEDDRHADLPRHVRLLEADDRERHDRVQAHA